MTATTTTLSEYLAERGGQPARVLVEHRRCEQSLGEHSVSHSDHVEGVAEGVLIRKSLDLRYTSLAPSRFAALARPSHFAAMRGHETTPGIRMELFRPRRESYAQAYCVCLPTGHTEKRRFSKLGALPVTFPAWKWGRPIDLPVVTF